MHRTVSRCAHAGYCIFFFFFRFPRIKEVNAHTVARWNRIVSFFSLPGRVPGSANIFRAISPAPSIPRLPLSLTHALSRKASSAFIIFPHFYLVPPARAAGASFALLASAFLFNRSSSKYKRDDSPRAPGTLRSRRTSEYVSIREHDMRGSRARLFFIEPSGD